MSHTGQFPDDVYDAMDQVRLLREVQKLTAERDRLRAVLEKIANPGYWMTGDEATQRARAALAESEGA